ncbi:hypothetical protein ACQEVF_53235 [Nonomuraea polychroma]|uniref:hypothetical protein n=1 Tax=Nonomuraea polychroma TaxID=46176 RepID=UPI003D914237
MRSANFGRFSTATYARSLLHRISDATSRLFAAIYPEAIKTVEVLADPFWRQLAAGDDTQLRLFVVEIGRRIGDPYYLPRAEGDAIAHWIEQDCWRPPSPPLTTFAAAPGHRRPGHLAKTVTAASLDRHMRAIDWFIVNRRCGNIILHHRTVHPVVVREWSVQMEKYAGAIWWSQRTQHRFRETTERLGFRGLRYA